MKQKPLVIGLVLALFSVTACAYVFRWSTFVANILFLLPPFLAFSAAFYAARTYHLNNPHGQSLVLLASGLFCLFVGELLFFLFQFAFDIDPYPSAADVFYLAAYPLLFLGFMREVATHKINWSRSNKFSDLMATLFVLALAVIVCYFGIYLAYNAGDSVLGNVIGMGYGVVDLIILVPVLFILKMTLDYRGGKLFTSWTLILLAVMLMMAGDILFSIFKDNYTALEYPYTLIDIIWVASYLSFAYSFYHTAHTIKTTHKKLATRASTTAV
jgi:hypothetical protein